MSKPFQSFMEKLIDYAGLFPPAQLPMEKAIQQYAEYRKSPDAGMLSRFICPAARLRELQPYQDSLFQEGEPFRFSVLGRSGKTKEEFLAGLEKDLEAIREFLEYHRGRAAAEVLEVRLPGDALHSPGASAISQLLNGFAAALEKNGPPEIAAYFEADFISFGREWKKVLHAAVKGIAEHNRYLQRGNKFTRYKSAGFKLRCGGVEPQMYPSPEQAAAAISACIDQRVPLKATAGLHHPVRHFNRAAKVKMHGFLNVFGAAVLAEAHNLSAEQIQEIIEDEDASNFIFTRRAFAWKNLRASLDEITRARQNYAISFGSCSFDEPREDLRGLKLL